MTHVVGVVKVHFDIFEAVSTQTPCKRCWGKSKLSELSYSVTPHFQDHKKMKKMVRLNIVLLQSKKGGIKCT